MLLTRRPPSRNADPGRSASSPLVDRLVGGLARIVPTVDRRSFLRRSGLGVGVGLAASQLTLVRRADAADAPKAGDGSGKKVVVRRTVCGHCSVGCA
ncbi:MAG TPA: twin-arginine translocation signal domain-containing protein, partial [Burkholderiaceae bacterium]|nr:twin-arginine translocation signal domain-containing protein [Burkholderiaceae bacterium]